MLFRDDYFFLSNFYPVFVKININGTDLIFKNAEAAFQAQKNILLADKFTTLSALEAKKLGKQLPITTNDWDHYRLVAMAKVLHVKFSNRALLTMLKSIQEEIVEDNYWHDTFWGKYKGEGKNMLGKMLMNIRDNDNDYAALLLYIEKDLIHLV